MRILFIGDIVGRVGRRIVKEKLPYFIEKYHIDFVIANGENATHGKGLIQRQYEELVDAGVDVVTLGNHFDSKNEIRKYIDRVDRLIRPVNLTKPYPGEGTMVFELDGVTVRVTNILGTAFINEETSSPYLAMDDILNNEEQCNINIIDYHGEATGEKMSFAYALDGRVAAVLGTHTHVQTADARILPKGTAFISDVGMCGYHEGVLGFTKESVVQKMVFGKDSKFEPPAEGRGIFSAVVLDVDDATGLTNEIFPIYYVEEE